MGEVFDEGVVEIVGYHMGILFRRGYRGDAL
jgi:hypothetical protein